MENKITAKDMEKYLAERYCDSRQWLFLTQVRSSTGSASRVADAMTFNMYGSTGYEIIGFEIKVSRSDWLSELKDMSKSDEIMGYCDKWFLVVSDPKIIQDGELPKHWGLLVLKDKKLVQKIRPIPQKTMSMPLSFIASVLRRSADEVTRIQNNYIKKEDIAGEIEKAQKKGYDDAKGYNGRQTEEALKTLRELVFEFEKTTGIDFSEWRGKEYSKSLGLYVKFAMGLGESDLNYRTREIESTINTLNKALSEIKKIKNSLVSNEVK